MLTMLLGNVKRPPGIFTGAPRAARGGGKQRARTRGSCERLRGANLGAPSPAHGKQKGPTEQGSVSRTKSERNEEQPASGRNIAFGPGVLLFSHTLTTRPAAGRVSD